MRILKQTPNTVSMEFDSFSDFVSLDRNHQPEQTEFATSKDTDRKKWSGTKTFDEAVELALNGWTEGRRKLTSLAETGIERLDPAPIREVLHDVAGFSPNVPMFCAGMPDCMMTYDEVTKPSVLRLAVDIGVNSGASAKAMLNYGAALLAYVELIEAEGIRCEIWIGSKTTSGQCSTSVQVLVKPSDQPFDFSDISFALAHPSTLRRFEFRAMEQFKHVWNGYGGTLDMGYGSAATWKPSFADDATYFPVPSIADSYAQCRTLDGAMGVFDAKIKNILRKHAELETA